MSRLGRGFPNNALLRQPRPSLPVTFDAVGAGQSEASGTSTSFSHTISGNAVLAAARFVLGSGTPPTITAKVGTTSMTQLSYVQNFFDISGIFGSQIIFGLQRPPTGAQTITFTSSASLNAIDANSVSYFNVTGFGTATTNTGTGTAPSISATPSLRGTVVNVLGSAGIAQTGYSQVQRWASSPSYTIIGDSSAASPTFSSSMSSGAWAAIAVPLASI